MLAAALLAALLYTGALGGPFLYDDVVEIEENPRVHDLARIPELVTTDFWDAGKGRNPLYRPLTAVTMTLLWALGGGNPFVHHLANLLLHAAASALVVAVALSLTGRLAAAIIAGMLFAAHPVHTEAVAWISGLAELLSSVCVLGAWLAHRKGRLPWAAALLALGLFSKEGAVVFVALALIGDLLGGGRAAPRWRAYAVYATVTAAYLLVRLAVLGHLVGGMSQGPPMLNPLREIPAWDRMLSAVVVTGHAVRQSVAPARLCLDYGYNMIPAARSLADPRVLGWLAVLAAGLAAAGVAAWRGGPRARAAGAGAFILLVSFAPASNFFFPGISTFAERNLYLPVLGACLAIAALLDAGPGWPRRAGIAAALVLVAAGGAATWARHPEFSSKLALFSGAARACPDSARARTFHAVALRESGRVDEAIAEARLGVAIAPHYNDARSELGTGLLMAGDLAGAERELAEALRLNAEDREARGNLSSLYAQTGRLAEALALSAEAVRMVPDDPEVVNNHASNPLDAGRVEEARALFERLSRDEPASPHGPNGLGALLARDGRWAEAAPRFEEALRRKPGDLNATLNLAQALSRSGDAAAGLAVLDRALASGMNDPDLREMRAALAASIGR
jgi:Flp pilus assembly protein TadD